MNITTGMPVTVQTRQWTCTDAQILADRTHNRWGH
jgi:hypothetical protein